MSIARRHAVWFVATLLLLGGAVLALGAERFAPGPELASFTGGGPWSDIKTAALAVLAAGALGSAVRGAWWLVQRGWERLQALRLIREAGAPASGGFRAIAVVCVPGLSRISLSAYYGAMRCLRLYLETALEPGERCRRVGRYTYGLSLVFYDRAAFERRLQVMEQDAGFLYMAAHPGLNVGARVTGCPLGEAKSARDALRRARADKPEHGG